MLQMFTISGATALSIRSSCFKRHIAHFTRSAAIPAGQSEHRKMMAPQVLFPAVVRCNGKSY